MDYPPRIRPFDDEIQRRIRESGATTKEATDAIRRPLFEEHREQYARRFEEFKRCA